MPRAFLLQEFVVTVCLVLAYQAIISSAFADPIRVLVSNWPPLVFVDQNGQIAGSFIDRLKAGETSTGLKFTFEITSLPALYARGETEAVVFGPVTRTPASEAKFNWIALHAQDEACFVTLKSSPPVNTLSEAERLQRVGVNPGGALFALLKRQGFGNLDVSNMNEDNPRKLSVGRLQAWFSSRLTFPFVTLSAKLNPTAFTCGGTIEKKEYWIAASKLMAPETKALLQAALDNSTAESIPVLVTRYKPQFGLK